MRVKAGRRDQVLNSLREQKLGAAVYYPQPLHLQKCFEYLGYKPGDLPVQQPTRLDLVINVKASKALGMTLSKDLLLRADRVIE